MIIKRTDRLMGRWAGRTFIDLISLIVSCVGSLKRFEVCDPIYCIYIYIIASHLWQNSGFGKTCWNYRNIVTAPDIYPKRIWEV